MAEIWIALDVGTTAIKAAAFDAAGRMLAEASAPTTVTRRPDGAAEQDPAEVWTGAASVLRTVTAAVEAAQIVSLGICAQGDGFWPLDGDGAPLGPAILWNDAREAIAADLKALTRQGATAAVSRGCNTALWPGTSAMGWRWLRAHAPETAARVAHIVTCGDWIGARLTGVIATDFANATIPFLDIGTRSWGAALGALDCEDVRERLPDPRPAASILGPLTAAAAAETGLPEGLPVAVATLDLGAMIVGLGMARPGETMMILGTTAVVNILVDRVEPVDDALAASVLHPVGDTVIRVLAPSTGAAAFDWFASLHPLSLGGADAGEIAAKLNGLVEEVPIGANGVTFLPYLNGERAPFVDPDIRAGFLGLRASTTKSELGRAVMEGTAFSLRHCFVSENGLPDRPVQLTGGGARNPVWCQIIADVIGQDVLVNPATDLGLWGAAVIGAGAVSGRDPIALAAREVRGLRTYRSDPDAHAAYGAHFDRYLRLSKALRARDEEPT